MAEMNSRDMEAFKHFLGAYKQQWDLNQYYRNDFDDDMEHYLGVIPEGKYPLPYNMHFNRLMPRIMTGLSHWLSHMYQPATHNFISVRARKRRDVERRPRVEGLLNFQMESLNSCDGNLGSFMLFKEWMTNAAAFGNGIVKSYWKKYEGTGPKRYTIPIPIMRDGMIVDIDSQEIVTEEPQLLYDGPYCEVRHNKCFVPHPHYRDIQKMPFVFDVYRRSIDYIWSMQQKRIYRNVDKMGWSGSSESGTKYGDDSAEAFAKSISLEGAEISAELKTERKTPEVDVIECYGKYIFPEDETSIDLGTGIKLKGNESEAIAHIGNYKALLSLQKNRYNTRPYFAIGCYPHPELFWDIGLVRLGKTIQEQINVLANTRFTNAIMMVNQMLMVREDSDIDPAALIWKPAGIIPVEDPQNPDVAPLVVPDASQSGIFREQEQFFEETISDMLGIYPYGMGQTPQRQEYVGTIYSVQSMGMNRMRLILMMMDAQGFQPLLRHFMLLNTWHLPQRFETRIMDRGNDRFESMLLGDLHWDYDFSVRYTSMEPSLGKQFKAEQLIRWAQIWAQMPFLQQVEIAKASLELMDWHEEDRFIKSPEQMQMEQRFAMQQQLGMMQANAQIQDTLAAKNDERNMVQEVTKALLK